MWFSSKNDEVAKRSLLSSHKQFSNLFSLLSHQKIMSELEIMIEQGREELFVSTTTTTIIFISVNMLNCNCLTSDVKHIVYNFLFCQAT